MKHEFKALALAALFGVSMSATAHLVDFGIETFDTSTHLLWRDLTGTTGISVNQMNNLLISDPAFEIYRRATAADVYTLFQDAGIVDFGSGGYGIFTEANVPGAQLLLELLGQTSLIECGVNAACNPVDSFPRYRITGRGFTSDVFGLGLATSAFLIDSRFSFPDNPALLGYALSPDGSGVVSEGFTDIGHFLVRDLPVRHVPEPATLSLLGLGLAGIGFMRRRKAA